MLKFPDLDLTYLTTKFCFVLTLLIVGISLHLMQHKAPRPCKMAAKVFIGLALFNVLYALVRSYFVYDASYSLYYLRNQPNAKTEADYVFNFHVMDVVCMSVHAVCVLLIGRCVTMDRPEPMQEF